MMFQWGGLGGFLAEPPHYYYNKLFFDFSPYPVQGQDYRHITVEGIMDDH